MLRHAIYLALPLALACGRVEFAEVPVPCPVDNFDDRFISPQWGVYDATSPVTIEQTGGHLVITPQTEPGTSYNQLVTTHHYDFTDATIQYRELEHIEGPNAGAALALVTGDGTHIELGNGAGERNLVRVVDGMRTAISRNPFTPDRPWYRLRHSGASGLIRFGSSPDAVTWYEFPSAPLPDARDTEIRFFGNKYSGGINPAPGRFVVDDVSMTGPACPGAPTQLESPPIQVFAVTCNTGPKTANELCADAQLGPVTSTAHGYGWFQCGGPQDRCPGGWSGPDGMTCADWSTGTDCVAVTFGNGVAVRTVDGDTVFTPEDAGGNCVGYNPGWTILVRCSGG